MNVAALHIGIPIRGATSNETLGSSTGRPANSDISGPKVSFVVPCYKLAHLLPECLNSILAQTYDDFEVLIMDDCSPDHTSDVVRSFQDSRIKYIRNGRNVGHLQNFNIGIGLALGEYVWLISADDRLRKPYVLERYLQIMETHPEVGYAFCPGIALEEGHETKIIEWARLQKPDLILNGRDFLRTLLNGNCVLSPAGLVRKQCYKDLGAFPLDMPFAGDWYLWCLFALHHNVAYFAEPMVNYRLHELGITNSLIAQDPSILSRDDLAVRWRIKNEIEKAGYLDLAQYCKRTIVGDYANNLTSKIYAGTKSSVDSGTEYLMPFEELDLSLIRYAKDERERDEIRSLVFSKMGDLLYCRRDVEKSRYFYGMALRDRPVNPVTFVKYTLSCFGKSGLLLRHGLALALNILRKFKSRLALSTPFRKSWRQGEKSTKVKDDRFVCIITETSGVGGTEVHTLHLMQGLIGLGYSIEFISNRHDRYDKLVASTELQDKVRIIHTNLGGICGRDRNAFSDWKCRLSSLRSKTLLLPKNHHDYGQIGFLRACRQSFAKVVVIEHLEAGLVPTKSKRCFFKFVPPGIWRYRHVIEKQMSSIYIDRFIAVSSKVKERLVQEWRVASNKIIVVENAVPCKDFVRSEERGAVFRSKYGIPSHAFVFGMLCRINEEKGIDIALKALQLLLQEKWDRPIYLVIAGDGPDMEKLGALTKELRLQKHVKFIGFVQSPREVLSGYDVILFPSRREGLPLGLLEGMSAGCIPVVTRVGGMPEAVNAPQIGWVVHPEDPGELYSAMSAVIKLNHLAAVEMQHRVVRRIQECFDLADWRRKILEACEL